LTGRVIEKKSNAVIYQSDMPLVTTVEERCRVCYTCVRECPAKAIRISSGQAEVIAGRCIGCGNCVRICSQNAKQVVDMTSQIRELLAGPDQVAACVAPSFPAEFDDYEYGQLVAGIRALGFDLVQEVGFGADLVARRYRDLLDESDGQRYVATTCPAIVAYVERYEPELTEQLAPIVSPMVATARVLRRIHGANTKVVFLGPCIAKKGEAASQNIAEEIDAVMTFAELRRMFVETGIEPALLESDEFDPPRAGAGGLFSISRGLLQVAHIEEDLVLGEVVAAEGRTGFVEAVKEFRNGDLEARLLEVLCCHGCIMGAGMATSAPLFSRRGRVSRYVRERLVRPDANATDPSAFDDLDLSRIFTPDDHRIAVPVENEIINIMRNMGKCQPHDELNCGACGYDTCREHAVAIFKGLAESEMCLPNTIEKLRHTIDELARSHEDLADAQDALMQSEKLASMGQLAAGIAHEVNNPLGVVLMYAHLLLDEMEDNSNLRDDLAMIVEQADRCKRIVAGLLRFARQNKLLLQTVHVHELVARSIKTVHVPATIELVLHDGLSDPIAELDGDQMLQVLTNLMSNAIAAMEGGGKLTVASCGDSNTVKFSVSDTGIGIREEDLPRIFDPFFTTKQIGKGTGLGLAVTYGVIKMHRGQIDVNTNADASKGPTGTTFTVTLPRHNQES
jgi:signal transduction histidine kinase/Fe-S-cluster-containing hydrogenase component 2